MRSSLDEAISLLSKWKADRKSIVLLVSNGPPDNPESFMFKITGVVKEISGSWVGVASGTNYCCLKLNRPGARFEYVESRDPKLLLDDRDRDDAERMFEGILSVDFLDEIFCVFNVLREERGTDEE
jgi:hypothetical protein